MMRCEHAPTGRAATLAARISAEVPSLETAHLRLRPLRAEDFAIYAEIACSPRGRFLGAEMSRAEAWYDFANLAAGWLLHGHGAWTLEPRAGGAPLGFVLIGLEPGDEAPELGFLLTEAAEGRGLAAEAAIAARRFAQEELQLDMLVSYVDPANTRAIRLSERLGAQKVGQRDGSFVFSHPVQGAA